MKSSILPDCSIRPLLLAGSLLMSPSLWALDGTWESTTPDGNWNSGSNWKDGIMASGADYTATFSGAPVRTVTLTAPITIGNLSVTSWTSGNWRISGSTLTLETSTGKPVINIPGSGATSLRIDSIIAGTSGFTLQGSGRLFLSGANTFTGGVTVASGILYTANAATMNGNTITLSGNGSSWLIDGTNQNYTSDIVIAAGAALSKSGAGSVTLSGVISETGGPRELRLSSNGGATGFILQGANTYTGDTRIGTSSSSSVVARVTNNQGFGTGTADIYFMTGGTKTHDQDAVELSNDITISDKTLTLRGKGRDQAGSLRSVSGDNTWDGNLNTGDFGDATIGVDADSLTIAGSITGNGSNGLTKVGEGTLILAGENSYTNGTTIEAGTLRAGDTAALGGGNLTVGDGIGVDTIAIEANVALNVSALTLTDSSRFAFYLDGSFDTTEILVSGNQTGSGTYTVDIFDEGGFGSGAYTLMNISGTFAATDFILGAMPLGFEGSSLSWGEGVLVLNVIPEPSTWLLLGIGLAGLITLPRFRRVRR